MATSKSDEFDSLKCVTGLIPEENNNSIYSDDNTAARGLFISPSDGVPGRPVDITGFHLVSANSQGKLEWSQESVNPSSKESVRVASTVNIIEPVTIVDGVTLNDGDRLLLKNQTDLTENGIYTVDNGLLSRSYDAEVGTEATGVYTLVSEGAVNGETLWLVPENDVEFGDAISFESLKASGVVLPAPLSSIASLSTIPNQILYTVATDTYNVAPLSTLSRSYLGLGTGNDWRQQLGLEIGVDVQAQSIVLENLILISNTSNLIPYSVGGNYSGTSLTSFARSNILNAPDASTLATNLGYITGTISTLNSLVRVSGSTSVSETNIIVDNSDNVTGIQNLNTTGTVNGVTLAEFSQLQNINAVTITNTQWGYLGSLDQSLAIADTPTFSGLNSNNQKITNLASPTNALDAANKTYVDTVAATGAAPLTSAQLATVAILPNSPVYASPAETLTSTTNPGSLTVDGIVASLNDRILVKNQADDRENGVYILTDDGASPGPNWELTRSSNFSQSAMPVAAGASIFIEIVVGASNAASTWSLQDPVANVDPLTDSVIWVQVGGAPMFTAGLGIDAAALVGGTIQTDITPRLTYSGNELDLNTVTVPYGGTGQVSLASNGVLVGQGVAAVDTSKAAPTGDFVGTTDTQTLINKTITDNSNNVVSRGLFSNSGANTISTFAAANPSAGQVLTATGTSAATWQDPSGGTTTFSNTITVSSSNPDISPNWTTVNAAITDAITLTPTSTNQVLILVYPGDYAETTPMIVPAWVTISGMVSTQNASIIRPVAPAAVGSVFTLNGNSRLYGLYIDGNDLAGGNATIGINSVAGTIGSQDIVSNCSVVNTLNSGFLTTGNGTQYSKIMICNNCSALVTQTFPFVMGNGFECESGGVLSGSNWVSSGFLSGGGVMSIGIFCHDDFSIMDINRCQVSSVNIGLRIGTGVVSNNVNDYPFIRMYNAQFGLCANIAMDANIKHSFEFFSTILEDNSGIYPNQILFSSTNPALPADPNREIAYDTVSRATKITFGGDPFNPGLSLGSIIDDTPGLDQTIKLNDQSLGNFAVQSEINLAQGSNYIAAMVVWQDDGGVFSDATSSLNELTVNPLECDLATTVAIDITSAPATIDGVSPTVGVSRILVKNGSTANPGTTSVDNGIYLWNGAGVAMTRTSDFANGDSVFHETYFAVDVGTINYGSRWKIDASTFAGNRITVGTTAWGVQAYSVNLFSGSPVANNDAFYIGSAALALFPGVELRLTDSLTTSSGTSLTAVVWEYFNGATWVTQRIMTTLGDSPYTPKANQTLGFGDTIGQYQTIRYEIRFGDQSAWVPTTVNAVFGYWIRCRVIDASIITQTPVCQLMRLQTHRTTIGRNGFPLYFGTGRSRQVLSFLTKNMHITSLANPGNETLVASTTPNTISQTQIDDQFNNGLITAMGTITRLPPQIDTSFPINVRIYFAQDSAGAGSVSFRVDYVLTTTSSFLGGVGTPNTTSLTSGIVTQAVGGTAGQQAVATIPINVSSYVLTNPNPFWFQVVRVGNDAGDTYADTIFLIMIELEYVSWCNGRYLT